MTLCATVFYAGSIITTVVFAVFALIPSATLAALRADQIGIMLSAVLIGAFLIAFLCARVVKTLVWESVISYSENEQLVGHLDQRRTQVEKLNVALKTNADKREQAAITLRRTAADLGLVQGKGQSTRKYSGARFAPMPSHWPCEPPPFRRAIRVRMA
jgi:hypothetical protein